VKRFSLIVLALTLVFSGCAQKKGKEVPQASRLDALNADLTLFQEQQRARDADIDRKLGEIVSRLDRLAPTPVQPPVAKGRRGKESAPAMAGAARQPIVAGQVIPLAVVEGGRAAQASQVQPLSPVPQTSPGQVQPLAPTSRVAPGQVQPLAPSSQAASGRAASPAQQPYAALNPPVVTLAEPVMPAQPVPASPRQPVPVESTRPGKGKASSRAQKSVAAARPEPAAAPAPAPTSSAPTAPAAAPAELAPAIPSMGGPAPSAPSVTAPAAPAASSPAGDLKEQQLYTEALRSVSSNHNEEGRKKFNEFMAKYPSSAKTPEALYWIGESYMGDKSYNQAILSFKEVTTRYPKDPKSADALYRIADAYERLGDKSNAAFNLKLLLEEHPGSEFTGKAKQKLKQLGQ